VTEETEVDWNADGINECDSYFEGPVFAWLSPKSKGKLKQAHQWTRCRDIVGSYFSGALRSTSTEYGGIAWKKNYPLPSFDQTVVGVKLNSQDSKTLTYDSNNMETIVWAIEDKLGLKRTELIPMENPQTYPEGCQLWAFVGDPFWQKAPPLLSMYLLLIRTTPYLDPDVGSLTKIIGQNLRERNAGEDCLAAAKTTIMRIVKEGTEVWTGEQEEYYTGRKFQYLGLKYFTALSPRERKHFLAHGKPDTIL